MVIVVFKLPRESEEKGGGEGGEQSFCELSEIKSDCYHVV